MKKDIGFWIFCFWLGVVLFSFGVQLFAPPEVWQAFRVFLRWFCFDFMKPWGILLALGT